MKRKKILRCLAATAILIMLGWIAVTIYVESTGPAKQWTFEMKSQKTVLVVFDPDPFYNLDEQVCLAFGKTLANDSLSVTIATVAAAQGFQNKEYDLIVYCANTYNWRPDWSITRYIKERTTADSDTPVLAITLGAGSTESSQRHLEQTIVNSGGKLIDSFSLWLWRPNDETKLDQPNVDVAVSMARDWAYEISNKIK